MSEIFLTIGALSILLSACLSFLSLYDTVVFTIAIHFHTLKVVNMLLPLAIINWLTEIKYQFIYFNNDKSLAKELFDPLLKSNSYQYFLFLNLSESRC